MLLSKLCSRLYQVTCIKISSIFVMNIPSYVQITIMPWIYSVSHGLMHMNTWSPTHSTIGEGPGALLRQEAWLIDTDRLLRVVALYHLQLQFSVCWQLLRCDKPSPVPAMIDRNQYCYQAFLAIMNWALKTVSQNQPFLSEVAFVGYFVTVIRYKAYLATFYLPTL